MGNLAYLLKKQTPGTQTSVSIVQFAYLLKAKPKGNQCHEPSGSPSGGQFCASPERYFTGTYEATNLKGKKVKFKFKVKAKDSYAAGDKVKEQAKTKYGDTAYPILRFNNKRQRNLSAAGQHAVENAGAEEKADLSDLIRPTEEIVYKAVTPRLHYRSYVDSSDQQLKLQIYAVFVAERKRIIKLLTNDANKLMRLVRPSWLPSMETVDVVLDSIKMEKLEPILYDALKTAALDGGKQGVAEVPTKKLLKAKETVIDFVIEFALQYAKNHAAALVGKDTSKDDYSLTRTTRKWLREDIEVAIEDGLSQKQLAELIQDHYAFSPGRAAVIARTELSNAYVRGNVAGWKATGVVSGKEWITFPDCCDKCDELNGEIVGLDEDFSAGVPGPTLHPNCKCDLKPVLDDEFN